MHKLTPSAARLQLEKLAYLSGCSSRALSIEHAAEACCPRGLFCELASRSWLSLALSHGRGRRLLSPCFHHMEKQARDSLSGYNRYNPQVPQPRVRVRVRVLLISLRFERAWCVSVRVGNQIIATRFWTRLTLTHMHHAHACSKWSEINSTCTYVRGPVDE